MQTLEGQYRSDVQIAIAVARWNQLVTERLLAGALEALRRQGISQEQVTVVWCPGSFELPLVVKTLAESRSYDGIIALGCVIRGETPHFDYVASQAASGIMQAMLETNTPCAFGVLTTDTLDQALERAGGKAGNKGAEAALTVLEMVDVLSHLRPHQ
ncbi:MAG: 6,7-dimethyl-8-ribityllumazine synthase [Bacteroidota bacterium]|nr:6,7-dimethyl-8-ribityllumazine synthase [Candidatus Kapabacteria bacterium]MDW8272094.1 6,7-dimethyl-8-ribityllumazine synthase [Bacteroidota bacterium]